MRNRNSAGCNARGKGPDSGDCMLVQPDSKREAVAIRSVNKQFISLQQNLSGNHQKGV